MAAEHKMKPTEFMREQVAQLRARAESVGATRSLLMSAAEVLDRESRAAWVRFGDVDNEWQTLMHAIHILENPVDNFSKLREQVEREQARTVTEDDGEAS